MQNKLTKTSLQMLFLTLLSTIVCVACESAHRNQKFEALAVACAKDQGYDLSRYHMESISNDGQNVRVAFEGNAEMVNGEPMVRLGNHFTVEVRRDTLQCVLEHGR